MISDHFRKPGVVLMGQRALNVCRLKSPAEPGPLISGRKFAVQRVFLLVRRQNTLNLEIFYDNFEEFKRFFGEGVHYETKI